MAIIYGLFDPRRDDRISDIRYIGQTKVRQNVRLNHHVSEAKRRNRHVDKWIRSLLRDGIRPIMMVIEEVDTDTRFALEKTWIAEGRRLGWHLTNLTDGGEGTDGFVPSAETREKQRIAKLGKKQTEEHKHNAAEGMRRARAADPTIAERRSASLKRFYEEHPDERENITIRNLRWWDEHPEARAERSERERAYNIEHPEMVAQRNAAIALSRANRDKSPTYCEQCGGGPYLGRAGLNGHTARAHMGENKELLICECGAGPFVGDHGLRIHRSRSSAHQI